MAGWLRMRGVRVGLAQWLHTLGRLQFVGTSSKQQWGRTCPFRSVPQHHACRAVSSAQMCVLVELPGASCEKLCPPATATGVDELAPEAPLSPSCLQSAQERELRPDGPATGPVANLTACPVLHLSG